jgi:hypothetical protein
MFNMVPFSGSTITQFNGTGRNIAFGSNGSDSISQFGGRGSISLAFGLGGNDRFALGGSGIGYQEGGSGNDSFSIANRQGGRYFVNGGSGTNSLTLPNNGSGFYSVNTGAGQVYYDPRTGTGVYAQNIQNKPPGQMVYVG